MKLKLTIAGKQQELTIEEAKALYSELAEMFGKAVVVVERPVPHTIIIDRTPAPQIWPAPQPTWSHPTITCQSRS